ncbi:unnamed protein product [Notodromas monacha]|uniref:Vacuolar protein sorting-associated protein 53 homolog n=1 Tax=Notodromas monacha TaxID=399045 RepID=A0A7R9BI94_9CRUS|nr:unnamed protein product [Notodromas monacha]CAG0915996.1 unnamed protein product [Notodromas monacha]
MEVLVKVFDALDASEHGSRVNIGAVVDALFPDVESLTSCVDSVIGKCSERLKEIRLDLKAAVFRELERPAGDPKAELLRARAELARALETHRGTKAIAEDLQKSCTAIRDDEESVNLRVGIEKLNTALKTLIGIRSLVAGLNSLWFMLAEGDVRGMKLGLDGLKKTLDGFESYKMDTMAKHYFSDYEIMTAKVGEKVQEEFLNAVKHCASIEPDIEKLGWGCRLIDDCLNGTIRDNVIITVCDHMLMDYERLFADREKGWLDEIEQRFLWFHQCANRYNAKWSKIFPEAWRVPPTLAKRFCCLTCTQLEGIMSARKSDLSSRLLVESVRKCIGFHRYLHARFIDEVEEFPGNDCSAWEEDSKLPPVPENSPFQAAITKCFIPFFYVYVDRQDLELQARMRSYADLVLRKGFPLTKTENTASSCVHPSAVDLFLFFRRALAQCSQVTQGQNMFALSSVFQRHLRDYAEKVLMPQLPVKEKSMTTSSSSRPSGLQASLMESSRLSANLVMNIQNLVKDTSVGESLFGPKEVCDSEAEKIPSFDVSRVCCILCTAEYCLETCSQLEGKIKEMLEPSYTENVNYSAETKCFNSVISDSVDILVEEFVRRCEQVFARTFRSQESKRNASRSIGEELAKAIGEDVHTVRELLSSSRRFFINFLAKFVAQVIPEFIRDLFIVDRDEMEKQVESVRSFLMSLPNYGDDCGVSAPASYIHGVNSGLKRAEIIVMMAKMQMTDDIRRFVRSYISFSGDTCNAADFQKILELKGLNMWQRNRVMNNFKLLSANILKRRVLPESALVKIISYSSNDAFEESDLPEREKKLQEQAKLRGAEIASKASWLKELESFPQVPSGPMSHARRFFAASVKRSYCPIPSFAPAKNMENKKVKPEGVYFDWEYNLSPDKMEAVLDDLMARVRAKYDEVAKVKPEEANQDNVLKALDDIDNLAGMEYYPIMAANHFAVSPGHTKVSAECAKKWNDFEVEMSMRRDIFDVLVAFNAKLDKLVLSPEAKRFLEKLIFDGKRHGLHLVQEDRDKMEKLQKELAKLKLDFRRNLDENDTVMHLKKEELDGVPAVTLDTMEKTPDGLYIVTMNNPHVRPILRSCTVAETRKKVLRTNFSRCSEANGPILQRMLKLRHEKAQLLGYKTHADFVLENRMAKTASKVDDFLQNLVCDLDPLWKKEQRNWLRLRQRLPKTNEMPGRIDVLGSLDETDSMEDECQSSEPIADWDYSFLLNLSNQKQYHVDHKLIQEYFQSDLVVPGVLRIFETILGLKFSHVPDAPVWHKSVNMYEVKDAATNQRMGYFFLDLYPRDGKYGHAAMFELQPHWTTPDNKIMQPICAVVSNFTPPTANLPSLLTHGEVTTFFHEFGHVMHEICRRNKFYAFGLNGVDTDFVEAPSQMLENWAWEPKIIKDLSKHYQTGKQMPDHIIRSLVKSHSANAGGLTLRQILLSRLDQEIHFGDGSVNAEKVHRDLQKVLLGIEPLEGTNFPAHFGHLAGGYDASYYGYLWSEVFSADMYESTFKQEGMMNPETGMRYRKTILEPGGARDPQDMLKEFLGREPSDRAFLKSKGIIR